MTAALLVGAGVPLIERVFPPLPLIEQVQNTPMMILAVLLCCEGIAFLALWRAAPDYRAFRVLGVYSIVVGVVQFLAYFGAIVASLSFRGIATALVIEAAGEAMRVPNRRWTRYFWPIYYSGGTVTAASAGAQEFGQDDDITVLTLSPVGAAA